METIRSRWSKPSAGTFEVLDPATGCPVGVVECVDADGVDRAVSAAQAAFGQWRTTSRRERGDALLAAAGVLSEHADELAAIESAENGKPVSQARKFDLAAAIGIFEFFAHAIQVQEGHARFNGGLIDITELVPFGVVAAIIPFNWPPIHTAGKIAPALAVGNTIVLKPGEQAPLTSMRIVELLQSLFPDGAISIVPGLRGTGEALSAHPGVRKLTFTGSPFTAQSVLGSTAGNLIPTTMELGGKNPLIVLDDADLDKATTAAIEGGFFNQGEACTAASRLLVQRSVYKEVVHRVAEGVQRLVVGDPIQPATDVGALVTRAQRDRVLQHIQLGLDEGAEIAAQAPLPRSDRFAGGFWVPPTLFTGVSPKMRVAREEIFGPVQVAIPFDSDAEAVEIANDVEYGLVASVHSRDTERALRVARQLEAGQVFINHYDRAGIGNPFGGTKWSGYGREHALQTLTEYGYTRTLRLPSGTAAPHVWAGATAATTNPGAQS